MPRAFTPEYYPGSKAQDVVWKGIINLFPPHEHYFEHCGGSGIIMRKKRRAPGINHISDINQAVVDMYRPLMPKWATYGCGDFIGRLIDTVVGSKVLAGNRPTALHYIDPPYPFSARRDQDRAIYEYEWDDAQHRALLKAVTRADFRAMCAISSYPNAMYDEALKGWHITDILTANHGGPATERIYTNYPVPLTRLHQYDHIGNSALQRQIMGRNVKRNVQKWKRMNPLLRNAILEQLFIDKAITIEDFDPFPDVYRLGAYWGHLGRSGQ